MANPPLGDPTGPLGGAFQRRSQKGPISILRLPFEHLSSWVFLDQQSGKTTFLGMECPPSKSGMELGSKKKPISPFWGGPWKVLSTTWQGVLRKKALMKGFVDTQGRLPSEPFSLGQQKECWDDMECPPLKKWNGNHFSGQPTPGGPPWAPGGRFPKRVSKGSYLHS